MKLVGLMPVRNESWVLGLSARAALLWLDHLVILDHASSDSTAAILSELQAEYPGRLHFFSIAGEWNEMDHRQSLLTFARHAPYMGASHIAIIDADEILTGNLLGTIRNHIASIPQNFMLQLPGYNLRGGISKYHSSGTWGRRWFSAAFPDTPKANWSGDGFHHREPYGVMWKSYRPLEQPDGGIMHLWGASERRLVAKHALYKVTETLRWPEKQRESIELEYSMAIKGRPHMNEHAAQWKYQDVPEAWWEPYKPLLKYLDIDQEPWQERHTRALLAEHGRERFSGLDLFGVA